MGKSNPRDDILYDIKGITLSLLPHHW